MKLTLTLVFFAAALICHGAPEALPFNIEPQIPRKIQIGKKPLLTLAPGNFEIIASQNTPTVKLAAHEIASGLSQVFGVKLKSYSKSYGKKIQICVGDKKLAAKLNFDPEKFDRDGFVIKTIGNKILIIGKDDPKSNPKRRVGATGIKGEWGTLFGAYDFLERFAGIRYYFPGKLGTYAPSRKEISLPAIDIYDRPDFLQRRFNDYNYAKMPIRRYPGWDGALNKLRNRVETIYIPNCHGLFFLSYHKRFGKTHPEYFAINANGTRMKGGKTDKDAQLCLASGIKDEIVKDAISFLKNEPASVRGVLDRKGNIAWNNIHTPGMPFFNIMPNDSAYHCRCEACWKHFSKGVQASSNYFWKFFADICNDVKKSGVPGFLTTMAYATYRPLPDIKIPDNLLVMLAVRGPWNEFNAPQQKRDIELLKSWKEKLGQKTWLWTYPGKYHGKMAGIPHTTPRALASFIQKARPYIFGLYIECESDVVLFNYLIYHVFGKITWNKDTDVEKLLEEHAVNLYGPAAKPMKEFFNSIERNWGKIASNVIETPAGPKAVYPSELVLWREIYSPRELKRLTALFDEAEKLAAKDKLVLERLRFIRKEFLDSITAEAEKFRNASDSVKNFTFSVKEFKGKGTPDASEWKKVQPFFLTGSQGGRTDVSTEVRFLYDKKNFYFRFDCEEPELDKIQTFKRPFDQKDIWRDSEVEIYLSPDGDRTRCYQILTNVSGSVCDLEHGSGSKGSAWNSNAKVVTRIIPGKGWQAEITLPRTSMRQASPDGMLANFARHRVLKEKKVPSPYYCWSPFARSFNEISRFGKLVFKEKGEKNLVVNPSFVPSLLKKSWLLNSHAVPDKSFFITGGDAILLKSDKKIRAQAVQYMQGLKPDTTYQVTFFLRMEKVKGSFGFRFDFGNGECFSYPAYQTRLGDSCPWTVISKTIRTPKDLSRKRKSYIRFTLTSPEGSAWVDDVKVVEK